MTDKIAIKRIEVDGKVVGFEIEVPPNERNLETLFIALDQESWPNVRVGEMPKRYDHEAQQSIENEKTLVCELNLK